MTASKVATMHDAIADFVRDGDTIAIEGFTHLICFAAGHEIIRQGRRDLTLCRMTPDVIYDQMVAAGVARKLVFSWLGNPGVGSLHAIRRVTEGRTTTIAVSTPAEKLITKRLRQLSSRCVRWYFAMPNPAMAKAVNTPIA